MTAFNLKFERFVVATIAVACHNALHEAIKMQLQTAERGKEGRQAGRAAMPVWSVGLVVYLVVQWVAATCGTHQHQSHARILLYVNQCDRFCGSAAFA